MAAHVLACEAEERMSIEDDHLFEKLNRQCGERNLETVKQWWAHWSAREMEEFMGLIHEDFYASVFAGVVPGGRSIQGKQALEKFLHLTDTEYCKMNKIMARDFGHNEKGDIIYYHIDYDIDMKVGPYAGRNWKTTANVATTLHNGKIIDNVVMVNVPVTKDGVDIDWTRMLDGAPDRELGKKNIELVKKAMTNTERSPTFNENWKPSWENTNSHDGSRFMRSGTQVLNTYSGLQDFLDTCDLDYTGEVFSGIVPGGANIQGLENLGDWMTSWNTQFQPHACVVHDFGASEDGEVVYFTADWDVEWKAGPYKGQRWTCSGISRKHMKNGKIMKDYYILNLPFDVENISERG